MGSKRKTTRRSPARSTRTAKKPSSGPLRGLFSHHRHTGRVLHHRHTSYPLVALLLLMVGLFLLQATLQTRAATVLVTATANGPLPPAAAVILVPETGDRFSAIPILVSGTCPAPYFVKLFRNQVFSGSVQCASNGTFQLYSDLFEGKNELEARIYNAADQEGPRSNIVTVHYDIPVPVTPPAEPGGGTQTPATPSTPGDLPAGRQPSGLSKPFFVTTDVFFKAIYEDEEVEWRFDIVGGEQPFDVTVAWGDGSTSTIRDLRDDTFTVGHVYPRGPNVRDYYPVAVRVIDKDGREATLQVFTILNSHLTPGVGTGSSDDQQRDGLLWRILLSWPVYAVTILMAVSFWLGERRGLIILARGPKAIQKFHRKHFYKPPRRHA